MLVTFRLTDTADQDVVDAGRLEGRRVEITRGLVEDTDPCSLCESFPGGLWSHRLIEPCVDRDSVSCHDGDAHRRGGDRQVRHAEHLPHLIPHLELFGGPSRTGWIEPLGVRDHVEGDRSPEY